MDTIDQLIDALPDKKTGRKDWSTVADKAAKLRRKGYGLSESYRLLHQMATPGLDGTPANEKKFVQAMSRRLKRLTAI